MPKHLYSRAEVLANFDFSEFMDAGRPGGGRDDTSRGAMTKRIAALRRAVGEDGLSLPRARELDFDAYAADLPRLKALERDYLDQPANQPAVGEGGRYRKGSALIVGQSRAGKDVLATAVALRLIALAGAAGHAWQLVLPSGEHSAEDVGRAEVAHHEDVRFQFTRTYDDALRYIDPNQAPRQAARNANVAGVAPRAILLTTSETPTSLALSLKARKSAEDLVMTLGKYPAVNVDEFLFRLGWVVEVTKPGTVGIRDLERTKREMIVSIYRVDENAEARTESVHNRNGVRLGDISTKHRFDPVAMIRGCDNAARFLAMSIIEEYSPDVAAAIPAEIEAFSAERSTIESTSAALFEERQIDAARQFGDAYVAHFRGTHLDGQATADPVSIATRLGCCRSALSPDVSTVPGVAGVIERARADGRLVEDTMLRPIASPWATGSGGIERSDVVDGSAA